MNRASSLETRLFVIGFSLFSSLLGGTGLPFTASAGAQMCQESSQRRISLNVENREGRFIESLRQDDLAITENKATREILKLESKTNQSLTVAILIDTSVSQGGTLPATKLAAQKFVESILRTDKDRAAVVSFTGEARVEQELTNDLTKLRAAIDGVKFVPPPGYLGAGIIIGRPPSDQTQMLLGATAIWDAIWSTTNGILQPDGDSRLAIVLLTDGEDSNSKTNLRDAIEHAAHNDVAVFSIGIADDENFGLNRDQLKKVSEETGGRAFFPKKVRELDGILLHIEQQLRRNYLLTYCAVISQAGKSPLKIQIEVANPQLRRSSFRLSYRRYGS